MEASVRKCHFFNNGNYHYKSIISKVIGVDTRELAAALLVVIHK